MNDKQIIRLEQFMLGKMSRSRIILYLLAIDMPMSKIHGMSFKDLRMLGNDKDIPHLIVNEIETFILEHVEELSDDDLAFCLPNGRALNVRRIKEILDKATFSVFKKSISLKEYQAYISKGKAINDMKTTAF